MRADLGDVYQSLGESPDAAVSVILKLRGETCDIDCLYCYEKRKESPSGLILKPSLITRLVETFSGRQIALELHGGEPLTAGLKHMKALLTEIASHPSIIRVSIQTNGVLLTEDWLDMFEATYPGIQIGVSLDGDEVGNAWRVDFKGAPTYRRTADALRLLAKRGHTVGVIVTVTPLVLGRAREVLKNLSAFSAINAVSLVPCFDQQVSRPTTFAGAFPPASRALQASHVTTSTPPTWAITPEQYAEFVLEAAIGWCQSGLHSRVTLEPIVSTIRKLRGLSTGFCHFSNLKCDHIFTLYPDGRFGSCDELSWPSAELGNLQDISSEEQVTATQARCDPLSQARELTRKCVECDYRSSCGGGCVATRLRYAALGDHDSYCDYRMRLVDGVSALLAAPEAAAGVRCRRLRWRPRTPNVMPDIDTFIRSWNNPAFDRIIPRIRRSEFGNINVFGEPGVQEADDLDPLNPFWNDAIEAGVRPIIDAITSTWGCVTYDSCEGHNYPAGRPPTSRRAGILPRNRDEYARIASALCRVITTSADAMPAGVTASVGRSDLVSAASGQRVPALDLYLEPANGASWEVYFAAVDAATAVLAGALRDQRIESSASCPCDPRSG